MKNNTNFETAACLLTVLAGILLLTLGLTNANAQKPLEKTVATYSASVLK